MTELNLPSTGAPASPPKRARLFLEFYAQFWADVGDTVFFKNVPVRKRVKWRVVEIEQDYKKVKWTKGNRPNFIRLQREDNPKQFVWTCSDQLNNAGFKQ